MRLSTILMAALVLAACGNGDPSNPNPGSMATVSGVVTDATGAVIEGALVRIGNLSANTGPDGRFEIQNVPAGSVTIITSASGFSQVAAAVTLIAGANTHDVVLTAIPTATVSGLVTDMSGAAVAGATVKVGSRTATTGADGRYEMQNLPVGFATIITSAAGFVSQSVSLNLVAESNTHDIVLVPAGAWGQRAPLIEANSELALAELNGKLYLLGGYPSSRVTARTVQVYDIATNQWSLGPQLPQPNNHGMAASVNGKIYLIGGQTSDVSELGYQNTVYELDPSTGMWATRAPMPTARGAGVAVVLNGKIYVAGGRPPHGNDFAVYDPAADSWQVLPNLPTQRNHLTGAAINGRIHVLGGRQGHGLSPLMTAVHEVFDPQTNTWTTAAPMLRASSGMNGVMARGCFHVWGGEGPAGMFPDHDFYDPRTNTWARLAPMPVPVHGVYGSAFVDNLIWVTGGGTHIGGSFGSTHNQVYEPEVSCQ